jgi:hypothetical protein
VGGFAALEGAHAEERGGSSLTFCLSADNYVGPI